MVAFPRAVIVFCNLIHCFAIFSLTFPSSLLKLSNDANATGACYFSCFCFSCCMLGKICSFRSVDLVGVIMCLQQTVSKIFKTVTNVWIRLAVSCHPPECGKGCKLPGYDLWNFINPRDSLCTLRTKDPIG